MWHKTGAGTTLAHYGYVYNAGGNVTSRTDSDGTTTTFGYDASDQLTSEVRQGGYAVGYTYDHNHNRASKTTNGATEQYTYDAHDKLLTAGAKSYAYDLDGNCTSVTVGSSVTRLSYDVENRVVGITYPNNATNSFAYNGEDLRVKKVDSAGTKNYVTDGASPASAVISDGAAVYTPGLSEHRGGSSKFYHADALGSTRGITDAGQAVTDSQVYDAFGNTVSRTGTTPTPFGFVGASQYQTDSDSGLQLLGHRYYDPSVGRFLSSDPAQAGTNWYAYCDNNPLDDTDSDGLMPHKKKKQSTGKSKLGIHQEGEARADRDKNRGEKGDVNRPVAPKKKGDPSMPAQNAQPQPRTTPYDKGPKLKDTWWDNPANHYPIMSEPYFPGVSLPMPTPPYVLGGAVIVIGLIGLGTGNLEFGPLVGVGGRMMQAH